GPSMLPTLENRERLLVNKFIYFVTDPQKDEIIVFKYPMDESRDFIKRVIAVGGDTVELRDGQVYINGVAKKETYTKERNHSTYRKAVVPKGHVFVLGDNRNNSEDSRYADVGFVPLKLIKGKASVIFWPFDKMRTLP
ncbi:MAG: signal peptidase I, partial [Acidaminococcaceae bacterium]